MIKNIHENIENDRVMIEDVEYIWNQKNLKIIDSFTDIVSDFEKNEISLESNIYYPLIYQIEDNCPTCGYRTPISRQKYSEEFIVKNIAHKLRRIDCYNISGINCYNKDITGLRELFIILDLLKNYDLNINVAVSNYDNLKNLKGYCINSIIFIPSLFQQQEFNENSVEYNQQYEEKVIKYIKENMGLKVTYLLTLNYNETHQDILDIIMKMKNLKIDIIELKGYDPFIDSPEEYNPQYNKEYLLKIILLLKLYLPEVELKIQYATNNCNYLSEYIKLGVNTLTGVYTEYMNEKLENIKKINKLLKK